MATKDFSKMTTKKLNALLNTASDEDKATIQSILDARNQVAAKAEIPAVQGQAEGQVYENPEPLTEEEEKALQEAEKNDGKLPAKAKMSDLARKEIAAKLRETTVNHRCQVVPFNTAEWVDGTIVGIVEDKRSNKVLYAIKLDDGRRIVKAYDSKLIRVMDEIAEKTIARRSNIPRERAKKDLWTPEKMEADIAAVAVNVGKVVTYADDDKTVIGRIISIVPDKRASRCMYRIEIDMSTEENPNVKRYAHKVTTLTDLDIVDDFDEKGKDLNAKFIERREKAMAKSPVTPESLVAKCQSDLEKAEIAAAKAKERVDACLAALEKAKAEYDAYLKQQQEANADTSNEGTDLF